MNFKTGGGNHLQVYDNKTGQYTDEELHEMRKKDMENLVFVHIFGYDISKYPFHYSKMNIHDRDYCQTFIEYFRKQITSFHIDNRKMLYLLTWHEKDDKSKYLEKIGYSKERPDELSKDLKFAFKRERLIFSRLDEYGLNCVEEIELKGHKVKTYWQINLDDSSAKFVTLIPGGLKK